MRTPVRHLIVALLTLTTAAVAAIGAQTPAPPEPEPGSSAFTVLFRGAQVGFENVTLARTPDGWRISSAGRMLPPLDLTTTRLDVMYAADWQPRQLQVEGTLRGQTIAVSTTFGLTSATTTVQQGTDRRTATATITPRTVVLPGSFFGAYEALAARLSTLEEGASFQVFDAPSGELSVSVSAITPRRIITPEGPVDLRQFDLMFQRAAGPEPVEIWVDGNRRLARVVLPVSSVAVVRDDLSSVVSREEKSRNPGDTDVFIASSGFNLGATFTPPLNAVEDEDAPAVVLVGGMNQQDRDYVLYGTPVFGELAGALSRAGYFVVRFDRRGTGQSGGRVENATIDEYANDVIRVIRWLRDRDDVDDDRLAVIGHGDGVPVALRAADREDRIRALALLAGPARTGREVTLEQQQRSLERLDLPAAQRQAQVAMQRQIMDAVTSGGSWEGIPADVRYRAETPWFRSWLLFNPADIIEDLRQPILIVHGDADREISVEHARELAALSETRRREPANGTTLTIVPGVDHHLTVAGDPEADEVTSTGGAPVSTEVTDALAGWLDLVLPD